MKTVDPFYDISVFDNPLAQQYGSRCRKRVFVWPMSPAKRPELPSTPCESGAAQDKP